MIRWLPFVLIAFVFAGCASESGNSRQGPVASSMGNGGPIVWTPEGVTDFESQKPGLGTSRRFAAPQGWVDVYDYDLTKKDWVNGLADPAFDSNYNSVIQGIRTQAANGAYLNLTISRTEDLLIDSHPWRHTVARFVLRGQEMESHLYMTIRNHRILKVRGSFHTPVPDELRQALVDLIKTLQTTSPKASGESDGAILL